MAIASITSWLNSSDRDYHRGKLLYEQYGDDRLTLTIIRSGSSAFHFNKLVDALEALNEVSGLEPKRIEFIEPELTSSDIESAAGNEIEDRIDPRKRSSDKYKSNWQDVPESIMMVRDEKTKVYAEARKMFETVRHLDSQEHRLELALQILDKMDFVAESWSVIDEYRETGKVREMKLKQAVDVVSDMDLKTLLRKSNNLKSYISKSKKALAEATTPRRQAKIKSRLESQQIQLAEMERRINEFI